MFGAHCADPYTLPIPQQENINACGQDVNISTFTVEAQDFEAAVRILSQKAHSEFAIRIGQGTVRLAGFNLAHKTKVVLLGHGSNETGHGTTIDLLHQGSILIETSSVCFQDLHLVNGSVHTTGLQD